MSMKKWRRGSAVSFYLFSTEIGRTDSAVLQSRFTRKLLGWLNVEDSKSDRIVCYFADLQH
ncbi:hypothetical protein T4D_11485 [Trichinella pseudospiralis]|uniref:Uncharacterized protein n=1 Tax=Trichinella pseudospiralis TaxID=6337 RepID=A0A0V1F8L4_TRIPS|nr:hypothetical protein T4D_11485 [Trichinella pseudospiralis]